MKKLTLSLLGLALAGFAGAADWPQWRGPNRDDVSKETGLLKQWPKDGPKLLWTFRDAGAGFSAPAIVGDTLYCMGADDKTESIFALDLKTQTKKWSTPIAAPYSQGDDRGDCPRGAPTVDGDLVFGIGSQGDLICVKASSGEKVWLQDFQKDLGGSPPHWAYAESPLVDGDQVVATPGGKKGTLAAFNKKTGDLIWRSKDWTDGAAYSSIVPAEIGGVRQYVQLTADSLAGVAPKDGAVLWRFARKGQTAVIPTPVVSGDSVFITSGYGVGCTLVKVSRDGDKFKAEEGYSDKDMVNHHGGVVLVDGNIYGYTDSDRGKWMCKEMKTGKVLWAKGKDDTHMGKGSLTFADGCLYCYGEDDGTLVLVQASPEGWNEKGRFTIPEKSKLTRKNGSKIWTHPVIANGKLYLRDQDLIFCYDVKDSGR